MIDFESFKHKTIIIYKIMCLKQVRVPLWNCGTDQNQTENAGRKLLLFSDCKCWNRHRKQGNTNIAKADSIIQCVLFYRLFISNLTTTQNLSFPFNYFEPPTPNGKKGGGGGGAKTAYLGNLSSLAAENSQLIMFI